MKEVEATEIKDEMIRCMAGDNGCCYHPSEYASAKLVEHIIEMMDSGFEFGEDDADNIAAGGADYRAETFSGIPGYDKIDDILNKIFDPLNEEDKKKYTLPCPKRSSDGR